MLNEFCRFSFIVFFLRCSLIESVAWNHIPASIIPIQFQLFIFPEDEIAWILNCLLSDQRQSHIQEHDRIVSACSATFCVSCKCFFNFEFIYCFTDNSYKMILRNQFVQTWWQEPLPALVIWFVCDFIAYASAHI